MRIRYGANNTYADVTNTVLGRDQIKIPQSDQMREVLFGFDPLVGVLKHVIVDDDFGNTLTVHANMACNIQKTEDGMYRIDIDTPEAVLAQMHSRLRLLYGHFRDEYPEQLMAVRYVKPQSTVLEIGGNIGRNSCIIGSILDDARRLVVLESDSSIANQLCENRDINSLAFHVLPVALSNRRLIQKGWDTKPIVATDAVPSGWKEIPTLTWQQIQGKCATEFGLSAPFDTLVADCEGALFYILQDEPTFLTHFTTVIMENDYHVLEHKEAVDTELRKNGLQILYQRAGGWGPCADRFFEVWGRL